MDVGHRLLDPPSRRPRVLPAWAIMYSDGYGDSSGLPPAPVGGGVRTADVEALRPLRATSPTEVAGARVAALDTRRRRL